MAAGNSVERFRGCLALSIRQESSLADQVSEMIKDSSARFNHVRWRPRDSWHVTLVTKQERQSMSDDSVDAAARELPTRVFPIGLGAASSHPSVLFVVCVWPQGRAFRAKHGLSPKDFHLTLSEDDEHAIDKSYSALVDPDCVLRLEEDALRALSRQLVLESKAHEALRVATALCIKEAHPSARAWLRLADAALATDRFKLSMLSCARAIEASRSPHEFDGLAVERQSVAKMRMCAVHTEYGLVFAAGEMEQVPAELRGELCRPWSVRLLRDLELGSGAVEALPAHATEPRTPLYTLDRSLLLAEPSELKLPRFFSWLVPLHVAAMSTPRSADDVRVLCESLGVRHFVTLTAESPLPSDWFLERHGVRNTLLKVTNYQSPSPAQIDMFMRLCCSPPESGDVPILVHCGGGKGRAGTMLACYLVAFGFRRPPAIGADGDDCLDWSPAMSAADAIHALRSIRPGSLETPEQEAAVHAYCSLLWQRRSVLPRSRPEPPATRPEVVGQPVAASDFLLLCGLPGSGKSSFSTALAKRARANGFSTRRRPSDAVWTVVDSDTANREGCERAVSHGGPRKLVLDRCNGERGDRERFLKLAAVWSSHATAVWFDLPADVCEARAMLRADHPSLPPGPRVARAMAHHRKSFSPPELSEGFRSVVRIASTDAALALVDMLSPPLPLMKFPRTPHLVDLGGATADDLVRFHLGNSDDDGGDERHSNSCKTVWPEWLVPPGTAIVVTEKMDGANMGISLAPQSRALVVQNRSHYVTSASHRQFQALDAFLERHREALFAILDRDPLFPGRFVLYGEWLAATHSVSYSKLQSLFYAFDLYDRETDQFWDRRSLERLLDASGATFPLVPVVRAGPTLPPLREIEALLQRESPFCDGRGEGVYVKWERGGCVVERAKVVRGDFIAGNEHWTRGELRFNRVTDRGGAVMATH